MTPLIFLSLVLIIGGLVMCWLSPSVGKPPLVSIVWVAGVVLVCIGLVLLLTPVLVWANTQLRAMLGTG